MRTRPCDHSKRPSNEAGSGDSLGGTVARGPWAQLPACRRGESTLAALSPRRWRGAPAAPGDWRSSRPRPSQPWLLRAWALAKPTDPSGPGWAQPSPRPRHSVWLGGRVPAMATCPGGPTTLEAVSLGPPGPHVPPIRGPGRRPAQAALSLAPPGSAPLAAPALGTLSVARRLTGRQGPGAHAAVPGRASAPRGPRRARSECRCGGEPG